MTIEPPNSKQPPKPDPFGGKPSSPRKKPENGPFDGNNVASFIKGNLRETIVYVLLVLALLMLLFDIASGYGSLLIGVLFSVYFTDELAYFVKNGEELIAQYGMIKALVFAGTLLAFFIKAPLIIIGAAAVIGFKMFLLPEK
jgi:hypothetical protein